MTFSPRAHQTAGALLALAVCTWMGCAQSGGSAALVSPSEWLTSVRRAHEQADAAIASARPGDARRALESALARPAPPSLGTDDRRVVEQDLWCRLAELELEEKLAAQAAHSAERGLDLGRAEDLFTSNLLVVRGRAMQALGRDTEAAASYRDAVAIDASLFRAALDLQTGTTPQ